MMFIRTFISILPSCGQDKPYNQGLRMKTPSEGLFHIAVIPGGHFSASFDTGLGGFVALNQFAGDLAQQRKVLRAYQKAP